MYSDTYINVETRCKPVLRLISIMFLTLTCCKDNIILRSLGKLQLYQVCLSNTPTFISGLRLSHGNLWLSTTSNPPSIPYYIYLLLPPKTLRISNLESPLVSRCYILLKPHFRQCISSCVSSPLRSLTVSLTISARFARLHSYCIFAFLTVLRN